MILTALIIFSDKYKPNFCISSFFIFILYTSFSISLKLKTMVIHYQTIDVDVVSHNIPPPASEVTSLLSSSDIVPKKGIHLLEFVLSRSNKLIV